MRWGGRMILTMRWMRYRMVEGIAAGHEHCPVTAFFFSPQPEVGGSVFSHSPKVQCCNPLRLQLGRRCVPAHRGLVQLEVRRLAIGT